MLRLGRLCALTCGIVVAVVVGPAYTQSTLTFNFEGDLLSTDGLSELLPEFVPPVIAAEYEFLEGDPDLAPEAMIGGAGSVAVPTETSSTESPSMRRCSARGSRADRKSAGAIMMWSALLLRPHRVLRLLGATLDTVLGREVTT